MDISFTNATILDKIPDWLWNLSSQIFNLDLSHNQLSGNIPRSLNFPLSSLYIYRFELQSFRWLTPFMA